MLTRDHSLNAREWVIKYGQWGRSHWVVSTLTLLGVFAAIQIGTLPFGEINSLSRRNPTTTAFIQERVEEAAREGRHFNARLDWISLKDIPRDLVNAVIVSEDGTFWTHHGFDWYELKESIETDLGKGRAARGASTITQQLVKNLYLSSSKNPIRKIKEWVLTWWMERTLTKSRILELYLNVIEWGDDIYGVKEASVFHFGKPVALLSREEAARLAAIIPSPRQHMANSDSQYVVNRSKLIIERMDARGL
jgi:monofunctional biosynthetic peptidoglycan transglycosylase